jgi:hypothetical protein
MQYGVVNLLNAGLVLAQDEEPAVRAALARFAAQLTPRPPHLPAGPALSTYLGKSRTIYVKFSSLKKCLLTQM